MTNQQDLDQHQERLNLWATAAMNGNTQLSFDDWVAENLAVVVNEDEIMRISNLIKTYQEDFREHLRPLAVRVLGGWAKDDRQANRDGRSWTAVIYPGVVDVPNRVQFYVTMHAMGHNDSETRKMYRCTFDGQFV